MAFETPKQRLSIRQIRNEKQKVPLEQILAIEGHSPVATGIDVAGNLIGQSLTRMAENKRQGEELARAESLLGLGQGELSGFRDLGQATTLGKYASENRKPTYVQQINADGSSTLLEIPAGGKFGGTVKTPGPSSRDIVSSSYVDSSDGTPLFLDKGTRSFIRSDGRPMVGKAVPSKGQGEAVQATSRAAEILPKIDILFDSLSTEQIDPETGENVPIPGRSEFRSRASVTPFLGKVFSPEINQLKSEVKQIGFTFGGKNFTGTEEQIIVDALIPGPFDNEKSREAKRAALKGYISGQTDLLGAANLLGPAGESIKSLIEKSNLKEIKKSSPRQLPVRRFNTEQEAEAAGLPDGTPIEIGGVPGIWRSQ